MSLAELQSVSASGVPIGIWVSSFSAGGTERQMLHLMRELDRNVFTVHALCFAARGPWLDAARERSASLVEFYFQDFRRPDTWKQIARYSRWCRANRIAAIIASDFYTNVFGLIGAALAGVPVRIGGRREINTDKSAAKLALQRAAYGLAHRIVANSRAAADALRSEHIREDAIRIVPNGIEIPEVDARERRPLRRAITVANLRAEKGHDVLIDALAMRPDLGAIQLDFAGDGPCRSALEQRARDRGVADRVRFLGERHDIPDLLRTADFSILPSRTEAFPNSVLEAMAAGLPVIASRTGGICELIDDGVTGLLVPPGDAAGLSNAIAQLTADRDAALSLGAAARRSVVDRYTIRSMVNGFTDILLTELDARDGRRARAPLPFHS